VNRVSELLRCNKDAMKRMHLRNIQTYNTSGMIHVKAFNGG
jgi:hypothetical protein